jgi:hypothetical protein
MRSSPGEALLQPEPNETLFERAEGPSTSHPLQVAQADHDR